MSPENQAQLYSKQCFLNSLLREWNGFEIDTTHLKISLNSESSLKIPLTYHSLLGVHEYTLTDEFTKNGTTTNLTWDQSKPLILDFLAREFELDPAELEVFKSRLMDSEQNMQEALKIEEEAPWPRRFIQGEQSLVIGHNFHPTPKSRDQFSDEDWLAYAPEAKASLQLEWYQVEDDILDYKKAELFEDNEALRDIYIQTENPEETTEVNGKVFPIHPWQERVLMQSRPFLQLLKSGKVKKIKTGSSHWYPTSSLRSLYNPNAKYMLKFSLSVRLTNSLRVLTSEEVIRGLQVYDVFNSNLGRTYQSENPQFQILKEPAFFALRLSDEIANETIVVLRENPQEFQNNNSNFITLASLTQSLEKKGETLMGNYLNKYAQLKGRSLASSAFDFLDAFANAVIKPMYNAQGNYGILLGAHQQNLVIEFCDNLPTKAYFRDCQGTGYTELGFKNFSSLVANIKRENGNVLDSTMGEALFNYYLIVNSLFNFIASLAKASSVAEVELIKCAQKIIERQSQELQDNTYMKSLLEKSQIFHKGNFFCCFNNINENTQENPFAIYTKITNPLAFINLNRETGEPAHV